MTATLHHWPSPDAAVAALAGELEAALRAALARRAEVALAVPGGRSPAALLTRLGLAELPWERVHVTLTDERNVPADDPASNAGLLRRTLLAGRAAAATFHPLAEPGIPLAEAARARSAELARLPLPFAAVLLGMGEDGHVASLFPGVPGLAAALDPAAAPAVVGMTAPVAPTARLSLNLAALLAAERIALYVSGEPKRMVLQRAMAGASPLELPVAAVLGQPRVPVAVHWHA